MDADQEARALLERLTGPDELEDMARQGWAGAELAALELAIAKAERPLTAREKALETCLARRGHRAVW